MEVVNVLAADEPLPRRNFDHQLTGEWNDHRPLTRDFRETVKARADRDPEFRAGLYQEAVQAMLDGDFGTAKILLRDIINATVRVCLAWQPYWGARKVTDADVRPKRNPRAENLIAVVAALKDECRLSLTVRAAPLRRRTARALEHAAT